MSLFPPKSIEEAVERLPEKDHPLRDNDFAIWYLCECRKIIDRAIHMGPKNLEIQYRIIDLDLEEYCLMKQTSFREDPHNNLVFGWVSLQTSSIWGWELNDPTKSPNHHAYWKISKTLPRGKEGYRIVFIESDSKFNYGGGDKRDGYTRRMLAILSKEELAELVGELGGQDRCVEGDVNSFVEDNY